MIDKGEAPEPAGPATPTPRQPALGAVLIGSLLLVAILGHASGLWQIPQFAEVGQQVPVTARTFDPHSITVAYSRIHTGDVSPWPPEATDVIMRRFVERWAEATRGRSRLVVMAETEVRDVLVVFDYIPSARAEARQINFAGGRLRYIELFAPSLRIDPEYTAETLLHELAHSLGCCTGPGTAAGHWVAINCTRLLCSPHGTARTFAEEELRQMGLEN